MARTLNNEISLLKFAPNGDDNDIKDAFTRDMICETVETKSTASKAYATGDILIWTDRKRYRAKQDIAKNAALSSASGGNLEALPNLSSQIETLTNYEIKNGVKNYARPVEDYQSIYGIEFIPVAKGGINVKGTSTGTNAQNTLVARRYIFNLKPGSYILTLHGTTRTDIRAMLQKNNSNVSSAYVNAPYSFTVTSESDTYDVAIIFNPNETTINETVYYMIREAWITDTTYQPYAKPNTELTKDISGLTANALANGAVNLMENKGVTETVGTIAWVVNSDKSVTGNGTSAPSSGDYTFYYIIHDTSDEWLHLKAGVKYKFSCCPSGGSIDTYFVQFLYRTGVGEPSLSFGNDTGDGIEFTPSTDVICYVRVVVKKTVTISNKVFKPMLTYGDIPNSDYSHYSYAKSNKELTDEVTPQTLTYSVETYGGTIKATKIGKLVTIQANGIGATQNITTEGWYLLATLPIGWRPNNNINALGFCSGDNHISNAKAFSIGTAGNLGTYKYDGENTITNGLFVVSFVVD